MNSDSRITTAVSIYKKNREQQHPGDSTDSRLEALKKALRGEDPPALH